MRLWTLVSLAMFLSVKVFAQDTKEIFRNLFLKADAIQNGTYEMLYRWKPLTDKDTLIKTYITDFERMLKDSLYEMKFKLVEKFYYDGKENTYSTWYTGSEEVKLIPHDSTATIIYSKVYSTFIKSIRHNKIFYLPFTDADKFFQKSIFNDSLAGVSIDGYERIGNNPCMRIIKQDKNYSGKEYFNSVYHIWVDTSTNLILRYDWDVDMVMNNDTMHQYTSFELKSVSINKKIDENYFSLETVPKYYKLKEYVPNKSPALLKSGEDAPDWSLVSLDNKKYLLSDFRGKLVLLDFFYKGCYPCMKALPVLQALHEKYESKGLAVVGLDPFDEVEKDGMKNFLTKIGITYITLYDAKEVSKSYKVSGYPTMYLIGKDGKIIYTEVGYGEDTGKILETKIKESLNEK